MKIRSITQSDTVHVTDIMMEHPLQFPMFVIEKYPSRWKDFFNGEDSKSGYYVAFDENRNVVIGHAGYIYNDEVNMFEIIGVAVKKDLLRQGIGKMLINTICNKIKGMQQNKVILNTLGHEKNGRTLSFYRNIGFEMVDRHVDFFREGYDRVTLIKNLAD